MEVHAEKKKAKPTATPIKRLLGQLHEGQYANVRSILLGGRIQPKLRVGQPNDKYEREADRVAEQVMRMPGSVSSVESHPLGSSNIHGETIQRACTTCAKDEALIQAKIKKGATPEITHAMSTNIQSLQSGGQPLSKSERGFFEPRIGADFSHVRVHNDAHAASLARSINARAFTYGNNVAFGAGEYAPNTTSGKKLLAHELTHVVQNSSGGNESFVRRMARGVAGGSPRANYVEVPNDEESRVDAAIAIIERISTDRANYPGCHRFFTDNCPGGTNTSFTDAVNAAVVWKRDPNPEGWLGSTHGNTHHMAYTRVAYDVSRWAIAATLVHELIHTCGQNDHDIGDQAKNVCGRLPNI